MLLKMSAGKTEEELQKSRSTSRFPLRPGLQLLPFSDAVVCEVSVLTDFCLPQADLTSCCFKQRHVLLQEI